MDQQQRLQALEADAQTTETKARLLEHNHEAVNAVIHAMREALATGMSWPDLERMVKQQRKAGNPVACTACARLMNGCVRGVVQVLVCKGLRVLL